MTMHNNEENLENTSLEEISEDQPNLANRIALILGIGLLVFSLLLLLKTEEKYKELERLRSVSESLATEIEIETK